MEKEIILNPEHFKYPNKKEILLLGNNFPNLKHFGFESIQLFQVLENKPFKKVHIKDNLYWWDVVLCNKLGKLRISYTNLNVNFNRHNSISGFEIIQEKHISKILFNFYIETFYFFLFSCRDIIYQIVNVFYNLEVKESNPSFINKVKSSLSDKEIIKIIEDLSNNLKQASEIRNSFTHRFPPNNKDFRSKYNETPDYFSLEAGTENIIPDSSIVENIEFSMKSLEDFIVSLKKIMKLN